MAIANLIYLCKDSQSPGNPYDLSLHVYINHRRSCSAAFLSAATTAASLLSSLKVTYICRGRGRWKLAFHPYLIRPHPLSLTLPSPPITLGASWLFSLPSFPCSVSLSPPSPLPPENFFLYFFLKKRKEEKKGRTHPKPKHHLNKPPSKNHTIL